MPSCRRRTRLPRVAVLAALAVLVPAAPSAAQEFEAFTAPAVVSADRYHDLGGHDYVMRFAPVPEVEPRQMMQITRVTLPIERRRGTSPGPLTVGIANWSDLPQDPEYDLWVGNWINSVQVPETAIPVADGPGYGGGTVDVPIPNGGVIMRGQVLTLVLRAGGNSGDLVLGAANPVDSWNIAKTRPAGGAWSPTGTAGLRLHVKPWVRGVPDPEPTPSWPFDGFYTPVNAEPTVNVVNAGSAVPFKFSLGGARGLDIGVAPFAQQISCDPGASTDVIEEIVAASRSGLTYDPFLDQYEYVWKTEKDMAGTCQRFVLWLADGSLHTALFRMR